MPDEFKSWLGKKMSSEAAMPPQDEDFVNAGVSDLSKAVASDIAQLQGMINDQDTARKGIEAIVKNQDPDKLIKLNEQLKPNFDILGKYSSGAPPIAKVSLGKRLDAAQKLKDDIIQAAKTLSDRLYENARIKSDGFSVTDDLATLDSIRADINNAAESYASLKKSFPELQPNAHLDDYLKRMPGMTAVQEELRRIEHMLSQDQSTDAFSTIKNEQKKLKPGWFRGKTRKKCEELQYKEGVLRCDAFYREIEGYVRNFGQLKKLRALLDADSDELRKRIAQLRSLSLPHAEGDIVEAVVSARKAVLAEPKSEFLNYKFMEVARFLNKGLREDLDKASKYHAEQICSAAVRQLENTKVPEMPASHEELVQSATAARHMIQRIKDIYKILTTFGRQEAGLCAQKSEALNKFHQSCLEQQKAAAALDKKLSGLNLKLSEANDLFTNPAFIEHDLSKAIEMMNVPQLEGLDYFSLNKARADYHSLAALVKKTVREKIADGLAQLVTFYETPIQQTGDTGADAEAVRSRVDKITTAVIPLLTSTQKASITTDIYSQRLENAVQSFNAQLSSVQHASEQRSELKERIGMMKVALQNLDEDRISAYSRWATDVPMTPYTSELAKEYISLVEHAKKVASEFAERKPTRKNGMPMIPYSHEAFDVSHLLQSQKFNLFSHIDKKMGVPKNPLLARLRNDLLCGNIHNRLSALEQTLGRAVDLCVQPEDCSWLSELKAAYSRDTIEGYLSNHEAFNVNPGQVSRINALFEKYVE